MAVTPVLVKERMCELILRFPAAAVEGIQWQTLEAKYNERHSPKLDIQALGFASPIDAAIPLLWDVDVRFVNKEDTDNPVLAVGDTVAMIPNPRGPATWPSLYAALCQIAMQCGTQDENGGYVVLGSNLKPLLQRHWDNDFDEANFNHFTDLGSPVRVKKVKHLLENLLRWRKARISWKAQSGSQHSQVDEVLEVEIEVSPSKTHNDLIIRCVPSQAVMSLGCCPTDVQDMQSSADMQLKSELQVLHAENERLTKENLMLEELRQEKIMQQALFDAEQMDGLDDPSEPPPFQYRGFSPSPSVSTGVASDYGFSICSGSVTPVTPISMGTSPFFVGAADYMSGTATPHSVGPFGQMYTMVPVFFQMADRFGIPAGAVQQTRAIFESHKDFRCPTTSCTGEVRIC